MSLRNLERLRGVPLFLCIIIIILPALLCLVLFSECAFVTSFGDYLLNST